MTTIKIPKRELQEADVIDDALLDEITEHSRWSVLHRIVFAWKGSFYETTYSVGATEMQDERPWEYESEVECAEVELKTVQVERWVPK